MAIQEINWITKGGQKFPTQAEAEYAELIEDIIDTLDEGGALPHNEFDTPAAVAYLIKRFTVRRIEKA